MLITKLRKRSAFTQTADIGGENGVESDLRSGTVTVSRAATAAENKPVYTSQFMMYLHE